MELVPLAQLDKYDRSWPTWEQAEPLLRLQLVPAETARFVRGGAYRPACEGLMLAVVLDFGDYATHVNEAMCALWGRSVDDVIARARAKLEASERVLDVHTAGPLTIYEGDDYVAIALYTALDTLASGRALVAFPSRDVAIITSAESGADGLAAITAAARDLSQGGLTANVYALEPQRARDFAGGLRPVSALDAQTCANHVVPLRVELGHELAR